jgi:hypothetical protein
LCAAFCRCDEHGAAQQFDQREVFDVNKVRKKKESRTKKADSIALGIEQLSELFFVFRRMSLDCARDDKTKKASAKARPAGERSKEKKRPLR